MIYSHGAGTLLTDGGRGSYGGLPFPDTGYPVPDVYIHYVSGMINVWDTLSSFTPLPIVFLYKDILLEQRIG